MGVIEVCGVPATTVEPSTAGVEFAELDAGACLSTWASLASGGDEVSSGARGVGDEAARTFAIVVGAAINERGLSGFVRAANNGVVGGGWLCGADTTNRLCGNCGEGAREGVGEWVGERESGLVAAPGVATAIVALLGRAHHGVAAATMPCGR